MKNKNLSWVGALFVFALLLWCTAVTPGKVADPATYTCAVYSTFFSLLPPVIAIVLALNTKEVYTSLLVGIASGALLYANGNLELALNTPEAAALRVHYRHLCGAGRCRGRPAAADRHSTGNRRPAHAERHCGRGCPPVLPHRCRGCGMRH